MRPRITVMTLGVKEEVDAVMEQARKGGAKIVKEASNTFWGGYAGRSST